MTQQRDPRRIGRYEIVREIGRGGMGVVYEALDSAFERHVAIKVLPGDALSDDAAHARFEREARLIASLEHEAIVPVYDYGEEEGRPYLVMRLMSGGSLASRLRGTPLPLSEVMALVELLAPALDAAHQRPLVHRDLKPGNILFDSEGFPYLSDFGIAKLLSAEQSTVSQVMGTPAYMSPEQVRGGRELDGRSDLYALAVIVWQMVTGALPFTAETPMQVALQHLHATPPTLRSVRPELPAALEAFFERTLAKEPERRFLTAAAFAEALRAALPDGPEAAAPPPRRPAARAALEPAAVPRPRRALPLVPILAGALLGLLLLGAAFARADRPAVGEEPPIAVGGGGEPTLTPRGTRRPPTLPTAAGGGGSFVTSTPLSAALGVVTDATTTPESASGTTDVGTTRVSLVRPEEGARLGVGDVSFSATVEGARGDDSVLLLVGTRPTLSLQEQVATMRASGDLYSARLANLEAGSYWWSVLVIDQRGRESSWGEPRAFTVTGAGGAPLPTLRPATATSRASSATAVLPTARPASATAAPATPRPGTTPPPPTPVPPTPRPPTWTPLPTAVPPTPRPPTTTPVPPQPTSVPPQPTSVLPQPTATPVPGSATPTVVPNVTSTTIPVPTFVPNVTSTRTPINDEWFTPTPPNDQLAPIR